MASENLDPNVIKKKGRVEKLVRVFENMKVPSEPTKAFRAPNALSFVPNRRRFLSNGKVGNGNVKSGGGGGGGQENKHDKVERWTMAMSMSCDHRPLAERRPNTNANILSLSSSSSSSDFFDSEQSHHKNEGDHSDEMQSSQSSGPSDYSFGGRRKCIKGFNSEKGFVSPPWDWKWKKEVKVTSAQPFRLRTEQRGQIKEQQFMKKIQQILDEEKKYRVPRAQGLPWTTDEPQVLIKPHVKEQTKPLDVKLHSTIRAIERAQFDLLMKEKLHFLKQQKLEEERLQKLLEEEEIKILRKKLIPRAQLMPFFDHPFIPKKSTKSPTIPKEPKFYNIPKFRNTHHTKCSTQNYNLHEKLTKSCLL